MTVLHFCSARRAPEFPFLDISRRIEQRPSIVRLPSELPPCQPAPIPSRDVSGELGEPCADPWGNSLGVYHVSFGEGEPPTLSDRDRDQRTEIEERIALGLSTLGVLTALSPVPTRIFAAR